MQLPFLVRSRRSAGNSLAASRIIMTTDTLKDTIKRELPELMREDPEIRAYILELTRQEYAPRQATEDRFEKTLNELREDREKQTEKWEAWERRWEEYRQEQARKWDEQNRKWDENQRRFDQVHEEIMAQARKVDRTLGALGARWGIQSEKAFRDALAGILEDNFNVQVVNVSEYDDEGIVFGRPDQVELDIIIKNGLLLICELKSSIDKAGMYSFERKARFYEHRHNRKATRLIVISPMIEPKAKKVAHQLGVELYGDSLEVQSL